MNNRESIEKTKAGFEESFRLGEFYNKQTRDEKHLELILNSVPVEQGMKILDLGTGSGYLAFPFAEISRVLKKNGLFFLSDPAPNDDDINRFVDEYMQMKKDGHIKFYTKNEWTEIGKSVNLNCVDGFETTIRFPRKKSTSIGFDDIIKRHDEKVIKGYGVEVVGDEIWITEKVNNLLFRNEKNS